MTIEDLKSFTVHGPRFIIQAPELEDKKNGLYLPTQDRTLDPVICKVISAEDESPKIKIGDIVLVNAHALNLTDRCISKQERLYIVNEADIFAYEKKAK